MTLRIVFQRAAKSEYEDAAAWHDERRPGLGEELLSRLKKQLQRLRRPGSAIPLSLARSVVQLRVAFHLPSIFASEIMRCSALPCSMVGVILPSGSIGYNFRWNGRTFPAGHLER